jgi:hypothetical protein
MKLTVNRAGRRAASEACGGVWSCAEVPGSLGACVHVRTLPYSGFTSFMHSPVRLAKFWLAGIGRPVTGSILWCKTVKN